MRCAVCNEDNDDVIDSRSRNNGRTIRRRRKCRSCGFRWTTYEMNIGENGDELAEEAALLVDAVKALRSRLARKM